MSAVAAQLAAPKRRILGYRWEDRRTTQELYLQSVRVREPQQTNGSCPQANVNQLLRNPLRGNGDRLSEPASFVEASWNWKHSMRREKTRKTTPRKNHEMERWVISSKEKGKLTNTNRHGEQVVTSGRELKRRIYRYKYKERSRINKIRKQNYTRLFSATDLCIREVTKNGEAL